MSLIKNNEILFDYRNPVYDKNTVNNLFNLLYFTINDETRRETMDEDDWHEFWNNMLEFDYLLLQETIEKKCDNDCMYIVVSNYLAVYVSLEINYDDDILMMSIIDVKNEFELEEFQA